MPPPEKAQLTLVDVKKKHCRSLKRSMLYGLQDISREILGFGVPSNTLRLDEFWAVNGVSCTLAEGDKLALIGPNGAGKSTLLKMLNGIIWPDSGRIQLRGRVGALIEVGAGFHPLLSGRENIYINGSILGLTREEIRNQFASIVAFAELEDFIDAPVKHYSSGMYVRLGFSIAMHAAPEILLVDEVLAVGDASFQRKCLSAMQDYADRGGILIFVTHNLMAAQILTDQCLVLHRGRAEYLGSIAEGANVYYRCTAERNIVTLPTKGGTTSEMRYGTGEATITHFSFRPEAADASPTNQSIPLIPGESSLLTLGATAMIDIPDFNIGLVINEQSSLPLTDMNTQGLGKTQPGLSKGESIEITFRFQCPLSSGRYVVSAGILPAQGGEFFDYRGNWFLLEVASVGDEYGLLSFSYEATIDRHHQIDPPGPKTEESEEQK